MMEIKIKKIAEITLAGGELDSLWRVYNAYIQNSRTMDSTTHEIYTKLKQVFEGDGKC